MGTQAMVRSLSVNGRYKKDTYTAGAWTANTYLPGFSMDYWNGSKDLGDERRRLRMLARIFSKNDFTLTFGQDDTSFEALSDSTPVYTTFVNLNAIELDLSCEVLIRGMPLALMILIPVFSVLSVAIIVLVLWCLFSGGEDDDEEGEEGAGAGGKDEDKTKL